MDCPVCQTKMIEEDFGGVMVDVCKNGCNGIWFDWVELEKLDENHEGFGSALEAALNSSRVSDDNRKRINCPKCSRPMAPHLYKSSKHVMIDECYLCGGFFLDSGELKVIRDSFMDDKQRDSFVGELLATQSGYKNAQSDLEKEKLRVKALGKMTKVLRPSRWGK